MFCRFCRPGVGVVRTVGTGDRSHRVLVQTFRWNGKVLRKSVPVPSGERVDLNSAQTRLEQAIWDSTYLPLFESIKEASKQRGARSPATLIDKELEDFVLEFTYNSNRIEGSTLSLEDTRQILERELAPKTKPLCDVLETRAHAGLLRSLLAKPEPLDPAHLLRWHQELFRETKADIAGQLRGVQVWIRGSKHVPPTPIEVRPSLLELLRSVGRNRAKLHPVQLAAEFHYRFENIHPFVDGNGRVGRLAMNMLLRQHGYPMLDIPYEKRLGYFSALEKSSIQSTPGPFVRWFFLRYARAHRRLLQTRTGG